MQNHQQQVFERVDFFPLQEYLRLCRLLNEMFKFGLFSGMSEF